MAFRFCTWNVDYYNRSRVSVDDRIRFVAAQDADAVALQEVRGHQCRRWEESGPSVFSDEFMARRNTSSWMISGLMFRTGTEILDKGLVPLPSRPQRAVWALARLPAVATPITFVSWHSQHGVKVSPEYKMEAFTGMSEWLRVRDEPVVLGADINTWTDPVDLRLADPSDPYAIEHAFVGPDPEHRLRDAYRDVLDRKGELKQLRESNPDGPLLVSHSSTRTRRDRILCSDELAILDCDYELDASFELSDHALHWATLELVAPT